MNTNSKRLGAYLAVMLLATAVATTLRTIACVKYLDNASGLFSDKSLVTISNAIILTTILGMLSYLFVATRISLRPNFSTPATYVPTGVLGVATAFLGLKTIDYVLRINNYQLAFIKARSLKELILELTTVQNVISILGLLAAILAFVSIAHHFLNAFITEGHSVMRAYFAIATITFIALYAIMIYLDTTVSVNDPNKSLRQMSFLFAAAFFLYEARISLGREMWRLYSAFGLVAATLSAYTSIPGIVAYYINGDVLSSSQYKSLASVEEYILLLAIFIFIVSRLMLTVLLKEDKENTLVKAIAAAAANRETEVKESFDRHSEIFASKQLSIFELYGSEEIPEVEEIETVTEEVEVIEEEKEPVISDDVIYESIFGKMPERPEEKKEEPEEEPKDERDPEKIAEDLLNAVAEAFKDSSDI